ncbi:MAG: helix-turn-helix domain-containing protein [Ruminococcus sp.]|nr:helix-turn-helix domain-containing protein [Ruminococcus sp.]
MIFNNETSIILSKRLKELREERGISQETLLEQLNSAGIKISLISLKNYEVTEQHHSKFLAVNGMNTEFLFNIAEFYGVSIDYLLGRTDTRSPNPDIQSACEYTGLSEKAVDIIKNLPILDFNVMDYGELSRLKALDMIINSKYFRKLLDSVCEYSFVINNNPVTEVKTPTGELTKKFTQEQIESMFLTISGDIFKDILKTEFDRRENDEHNSKQK